jgi:hypothetical protein
LNSPPIYNQNFAKYLPRSAQNAMLAAVQNACHSMPALPAAVGSTLLPQPVALELLLPLRVPGWRSRMMAELKPAARKMT